MKMLAGVIAALSLVATVFVGAANAAEGKCTSLQARCALEIGGECDPKTGRWVYGYWQGINHGGSNRGGAFDVCISRGLAKRK
jgi:uncharacterized membrane protein